MSSGHRTLTVLLAIICTLVLTIAGLCTDWPVWLWPAPAAVLLTGLITAIRAAARPPGYIAPENTLEPDLPIPPPLRQEHRVTNVALPSAAPDYDFLFSATVRWIPQDSEISSYFDPSGLAVQSVLLRARTFTARQHPTSSTMAQHELNGVLGVMEPDSSGRVLAMAKNVTLTLSDTDLERLTKLSNVRKDEEVWEHERNYERSKRTYLADDVLKDPGSAVVWWLARNEEHVERTVERIGLLAQLSAAANNSEVAEPFRELLYSMVPEQATEYEPRLDEPPEPSTERAAEALMRWLGLGRDDPQMRLLADRFAVDLRAAGKKEEAEEFSRLFAFPDDSPADEEGDPSRPDPPPSDGS
ncbi:hypothetical protein [Streptomyces litchfieldiae]|uniref:Secreted protein n=1 Tax=Streptomyces litchfieldiae TaxID=3075543 RepID=A0ABU2MSI1_9ACTN|nr:hypothetical protein [Streptomyces sp. DSM 44938]MDT0344416.1 hypothetical protein [Streptomyces sp. DSM 44938]